MNTTPAFAHVRRLIVFGSVDIALVDVAGMPRSCIRIAWAHDFMGSVTDLGFLRKKSQKQSLNQWYFRVKYN